MAGQFLFAHRIISSWSEAVFYRSEFACRNLNLVKYDDNLTSLPIRLFNTAQLVVLAYTVYFWLITCRIPPNYLLLGTLKRCERTLVLLFTQPHDHLQEYGPLISHSELSPQRSGTHGLMENPFSTSSPPWYNRRFAEFKFPFSLFLSRFAASMPFAYGMVGVSSLFG